MASKTIMRILLVSGVSLKDLSTYWRSSKSNKSQPLPRKVSLGSRAVEAAWCSLPSLELPVEPVLLWFSGTKEINFAPGKTQTKNSSNFNGYFLLQHLKRAGSSLYHTLRATQYAPVETIPPTCTRWASLATSDRASRTTWQQRNDLWSSYMTPNPWHNQMIGQNARRLPQFFCWRDSIQRRVQMLHCLTRPVDPASMTVLRSQMSSLYGFFGLDAGASLANCFIQRLARFFLKQRWSNVPILIHALNEQIETLGFWRGGSWCAQTSSWGILCEHKNYGPTATKAKFQDKVVSSTSVSISPHCAMGRHLSTVQD